MKSAPGYERCTRLTYDWIKSGDREVWPGDPASTPYTPPYKHKVVECGYTGTAEQLVCHRIATHRVPLALAMTQR